MQIDDKTLQALGDYIDGALSPDQRAVMEARLRQDAGLRDELNAFQRLDKKVRALADQPVALDWERFREEARRRRELLDAQRRVSRLKSFTRPVAAAATIAVLLSGGWWYWKPGSVVHPSAGVMRAAYANVTIQENFPPLAPHAAIVSISGDATPAGPEGEMILKKPRKRTLIVAGSMGSVLEDESVPLF